MDDKELLELAAKAAGIDTSQWCDLIQSGCGCGFVLPDSFGDLWNPLTYDGDALRLAVHLGLTINPFIEGVFVSRFEGEQVIAEKWSDDKMETTRRAIVRAAAEIGKSIT